MTSPLTRWSAVCAAGRWFGVNGSHVPCPRRLYMTNNIVQENDVVILKESKTVTKKGRDSADPVLTNPLQKTGGRIDTKRGTIEEGSLIGRRIREVVRTTKGTEYRIFRPTLGEYVRFTPRILTPIYPQDANLIVSLLDLHPTPPTQAEANDPPLEIFEAGTGHGSLTLHLARAIHAANPPAPKIPPPKAAKVKPRSKLGQLLEPDLATPVLPHPELDLVTEDTSLIDEENLAITAAYEAYLPTRRAIIQTLDITPRHTALARRVVRNFRHGMYFPDIDFHTGTIPGYLSSRLAENGDHFLAHAILDLPDPQEHFEIVSRALRPDGILLVYCPSISQIMECVQLVKKEFLPFILESTLEIGAAAGTGGREWDLRLVKPKAKAQADASSITSEIDPEEDEMSLPDSAEEEANIVQAVKESDLGWKVICRPRILARFSGGGFVAVFRRMEMR